MQKECLPSVHEGKVNNIHTKFKNTLVESILEICMYLKNICIHILILGL